MKTCSNCGAPNPSRLIICFSCGDNLDGASTDLSNVSGTVSHCSNCQARFTEGADACPNCGRIFETKDATAPQEALPFRTDALSGPAEYVSEILKLRGWTAERLADGSTRLRRSVWQRINNDFPLPIVCAVIGATLLCQDGRQPPNLDAAVGLLSLSGVFSWTFLLVGVGLVLWQVGAIEDIRMRSGFFERTKALGPIAFRHRFEVVADIQSQTRRGRDRNGGYATQSLVIANLGQRLTLHKRVLRDSFFGIDGGELPPRDDDIAQLGRFIAATTGWRFTENI